MGWKAVSVIGFTSLVGCGGPGLQCGAGTYEEDGWCVADVLAGDDTDVDSEDDTPADTDGPGDTEEPEDSSEVEDPDPGKLPPFFGEIEFIDANGMAAFCAVHDTVYGDVSIRGSLVFELSQLACLRVIVGDLVINADQLQAVSLPNLTRIDGDLNIRGLGLVQAVDLPALRRVRGSISVGGGFHFPTLISLDLRALTEVGIDLWLTDTDVLAAIQLPALTTVGRHAWFRRHLAVQRIDAPLLSSLGGALRFDDNTALTDTLMPQLGAVGSAVTGELAIERNSALGALSGLASVRGVSGSLIIKDNPLLPQTACDGLRDAIGVDQISGLVVFGGNGTGIAP